MRTDPAALAFVGAGALDQAFAGFLAANGPDVVFGRALEVEQAFGDLVERVGVAVAVARLTLIRDILRGIDPGR